MHYVAFIHQDDEPGYGISFPDFPGCISAGDTMDEVLRRGAEALAFHVEGMKEHDEPIPAPRELPAILADDTLAEWRSGATFTSVPLVPES